jgi:hypothetical protein
MEKYAPSPRQVMWGRVSSSGLHPIAAAAPLDVDVGACAAALPREPWNWVCLEPQPTLIGAPSFFFDQSDGGVIMKEIGQTFTKLGCVQRDFGNDFENGVHQYKFTVTCFISQCMNTALEGNGNFLTSSEDKQRIIWTPRRRQDPALDRAFHFDLCFPFPKYNSGIFVSTHGSRFPTLDIPVLV